jgi:hypothetical protein
MGVEMNKGNAIRRAQSCATDARQAAREFHAAVAQPDMAFVLFFCSSDYDLDALGAEMNVLFAGTQVIVGCTTAGEIGPAGYRDRTISGASFPAEAFTAVSGCLDKLQQFAMPRAEVLAQDLLRRLEDLEPDAAPDNSFGLLLIDGLSEREEAVTGALHHSLGEVPLLGGSAGDGLNFGSTHVYFDGAFREENAVLLLVSTSLPFTLFKTQHFVPTDDRVVVTEADAEHRIVNELDGWPAADAYARLVGGDVSSLDPMRFSAHPVAVLIDGTNYVRSIQKANPDGSLTFFCAIEEGLVLRSAVGVNLIENLKEAFAAIHATLGKPQLVVGFDCVLRKLELVKLGQVGRVEEVLDDNNVIGFNSYGEQYRGVHVNQTFVGIAIGEALHGT